MNSINQEMYNQVKEDKSVINYSVSIANKLDSIESAILLNAIYKLWLLNDKQPFYKFKEPCLHPSYKKGESWLEYLGFSKRNFDTALKKLKEPSNKNNKSISVVITKTTIDRKTFYSINSERLEAFALGEISLDTRDDLYLLYNSDTKLLKIGRSKEVKKRLKSIQRTAKSKNISIVKQIPNKGDLEKSTHEKFSKYNVTGEWFQDVKEIREFFQSFK